MGLRGPNPTPSVIKERRGSYRLDRAPLNEATPNLASGIQLIAPEWLSDGAREKWEELALRLHNLGLLTEIDLDVFSAYCVSWSNWRSAEDSVKEFGPTTTAQSGYTQVSAHVTRAKNHLAEIIKLGALLGLSPSARTRVEVPAGAGLKPTLQKILPAQPVDATLCLKPVTWRKCR